MAMIWRMDAPEVRRHFISTDNTVGQFLRASEEEWKTVPKDWYGARDSSSPT
jgi:hypothetical protein